MPEIRSDDGRYLLAVQGDGNSVVYDNGRPVWDRWGYEAAHWAAQSRPDTPQPVETKPIEPLGQARVIRVTDESDGELIPRMYSYWSNAWAIEDAVYVFAGHVDGRPRLFKVDLWSGQVERRDWWLPYAGTTEGWSFGADGWISLCDGPVLRRANPFTGEDWPAFTIEHAHPWCDLWQPHGSDDGQTYSATVRRMVSDGAYPKIGTVVYRHGRQDFYPAEGTLDESQIDASGRYLVIKEDDDNRIINLETRETRRLSDADGAVGHSDCGDGILVGEDNIHGACVLWDLRQPLTPERRRTLFSTWNMGHVSIRGGRCLLSDPTHLSLVALDGSGVTPLLAHGMVGSGYDFQVQGNLSPCGRVACWMSNAAGRMDVYMALLNA